MNIRKATIDDIDQIRQLFHDTITTVNVKDYTPEQIALWASAYRTMDWARKIREQHFFVAELNDQIVGFGSITNGGYLDYMYTHKDFQGQGIATQLLSAIEQVADMLDVPEIQVEVSITARPFFARRGFALIKVFQTTVDGIGFQDSIMTKAKKQQ